MKMKMSNENENFFVLYCRLSLQFGNCFFDVQKPFNLMQSN
jgi:hypothetical protein